MVKCDGDKDCNEPIGYIDHKGWAYCATHGQRAQLHRRCRKLRPAEVAKLESGQPIARY